MRLYFYTGFNNYYNRKVRKFDTIQEYQDYLIYIIDNISFDPKDGINTTQIVNTRSIISNQAFISDTPPDYAILCEDDGDIVSRWFVMQWERKCKGQYLAQLRRDVIADNFTEIINAPCFVEKATITDIYDTAIFNNENMGFNQIKMGEDLLKDPYYKNTAWVVGYVPTNMETSWLDDNNQMQPTIVSLSGQRYMYLPSTTLERPIPKGMPFKMFCMPYGSQKFSIVDSDHVTIRNFTTDNDVQVAIAGALANTYGSQNIYDIQLLPYCPIRNQLIPNPNDNTIYFDKDDIPCEFIRTFDAPGQEVGIIFWCDTSKGSFDIDYTVEYPDNVEDIKVINETEMYRLCSPNYNGQFEFNPMKNGGITKIEVDYMYQPQNPYLHLCPKFSLLYGFDYNDCRGLICGGDFSLPLETSAWADYQLQNKNFQQIFDRQIENMEFNNNQARKQAYANFFTGALTGVGAGAALGTMVGGPIGAAIGGVGGGLASIGAGIADIAMLDAKQKETIDYTEDLFGYQMGNIKAMPNGISKTNPFTNNNKIFPVIERYKASDEEIQAFKDKIKYNGMTVMRIGKIKDWLLNDYSYIKGQLIMLDGIREEYHTVVEIASELNKGIRAKKEEA